MRKAKIALTSLLLLGGCALLPPADQPASVERMGRFIGLVGKCGCSDLTEQQVWANYPKAVANYCNPDQARMKGWVQLGLEENYDNQMIICAEVCGQSCMVNAVAQPMGANVSGPGCFVSERNLHLTMGTYDDLP